MYIVSACLLGENCKYSGGNNETPWVVSFAKAHSCCSLCPEVAGGLPVPRPPSELSEGRVMTEAGEDLTRAFEAGALKCFDEALALAKERGQTIEGAILKSGSPSCGSGRIYDGSFSGIKIEGDGIFAKYLKAQGIPVITEESECAYPHLIKAKGLW